ncbi:hypothetical protein FB451DRAFT_1165183 [Mycena latifolia]|nr:hypothetical protein FB451DRAFT_1165183 [Mycena latifolia]
MAARPRDVDARTNNDNIVLSCTPHAPRSTFEISEAEGEDVDGNACEDAEMRSGDESSESSDSEPEFESEEDMQTRQGLKCRKPSKIVGSPIRTSLVWAEMQGPTSAENSAHADSASKCKNHWIPLDFFAIEVLDFILEGPFSGEKGGFLKARASNPQHNLGGFLRTGEPDRNATVRSRAQEREKYKPKMPQCGR